MIKQYEDELRELKQKMTKAEKFATKLPVFKEEIIERKITGEEDWIVFGSSYKDTPYGWNINRGNYKFGTSRYITNYSEDSYDVHLFNLYFNTVSLFDGYGSHGLSDIASKVPVYFFDTVNSTFYIEDEHIEKFLDLANDWYLKAYETNRKATEKKRVAKLKEELAALEKTS